MVRRGSKRERKDVNLSQQMTLLGLAAMIFYSVLLAAGIVGVNVMPQFLVSAFIFLTSGRLMRQLARNLPAKEKPEKKKTSEPDWAWLSQFLNWFMALLIIGLLALWVMKPVGVSFFDSLKHHQPDSQPYFSDSIP